MGSERSQRISHVFSSIQQLKPTQLREPNGAAEGTAAPSASTLWGFPKLLFDSNGTKRKTSVSSLSTSWLILVEKVSIVNV